MGKEKFLVVITGGASGLGKAAAELFAKEGYSLLLLDYNLEDIKTLKIKKAECLKVDVRDFNQFKSAIDETESKLKLQVDLLINCAGVMPTGSIIKSTVETLDKIIDINLKGTIHGVKAVLPGMVSRERGTIINISSISAFTPAPLIATYCSSKVAIRTFTDATRKEVFSKNVRLTAILPGAFKTNLMQHSEQTEEFMAAYKDYINVGSAQADPKYLADLFLHLYQLPQEISLNEVTIAATKERL